MWELSVAPKSRRMEQSDLCQLLVRLAPAHKYIYSRVSLVRSQKKKSVKPKGVVFLSAFEGR
jgi:hypothetical protein